MKLKRLEIKNFKGIKNLELSFEGTGGGELRFLTCLVGDNGSGKTTVLQAIALVLSLATYKTRGLESFAWNGFVPERMESFGPTRIVAELELDDDEVEFSHAVANVVRKEVLRGAVNEDIAQVMDQLSSSKAVVVEFTSQGITSPEGEAGLMKLKGRYFWEYTPYRDQSPRLGDVFWFDQFRILGSGLIDSRSEYGSSRGKTASSNNITWGRGVGSLRELLVGWWIYHKSERTQKGRDFIAELEPRVAEMFPGTRFIGVEPRPGVRDPTQSDFYFLLERGDAVYDIGEMSSGEQAVFQILYEFVRLSISKSVVLIDELELHLHPPQQQALLAALPKLGPDCQFIITTHSPYLENAIPEEEIVRL